MSITGDDVRRGARGDGFLVLLHYWRRCLADKKLNAQLHRELGRDVVRMIDEERTGGDTEPMNEIASM